MKLLHMVSAFLCCWLMLCATAVAAPPESWQSDMLQPNPLDGMSLAEIKALPEFSPIEKAPFWLRVPSNALQSAEPDSQLAFVWVGYIEVARPDSNRVSYVVIDDTGAAVTMMFSYLSPYGAVPAWAVNALDYLYEIGYYEGCPD